MIRCAKPTIFLLLLVFAGQAYAADAGHVNAELLGGGSILQKVDQEKTGPTIVSGQITTLPLPEISVDATPGEMESVKSLGENMWRGTSHGAAVRLLQGLPADISSPVLRDLFLRLLLTGAVPPKKEQFEEHSDRRLITLRLQKLWQAGRIREYLALYDAIPASAAPLLATPDLIVQQLRRGDNDRACGTVDAVLRSAPQNFSFQRLQAICLALRGEEDRARLAVDLLKERVQEDKSNIFFSLFDALLHKDQKIKLTAHDKQNLDSVNWFLAEKSGVQMDPPQKPRAVPALAQVAYYMPHLTPPQKLDLAQNLLMQGILPVDELLQLYAGMIDDPAGQKDWQDIASDRKLAGPHKNALIANALDRIQDRQHQAKAMQAVFNTVPQNTEEKYLWAQILAAKMQDFPQNTDYVWFAPAAMRIHALTGQYNAAKSWLDIAVLDDAAAADAWPYLRLLRMVDSYSPRAKLIQENWARKALGDAPDKMEYRLGVAALFAKALGDDGPIFSAKLVPSALSANMFAQLRQNTPSPALLAALSLAQDEQAKAEGVALVLYACQGALNEIAPQAVASCVEALQKLSFGVEARLLAFEAMVLSGL